MKWPWHADKQILGYPEESVLLQENAEIATVLNLQPTDMKRHLILTFAALVMAALASCSQKDVYDVYLLIGQSNMAGRGALIPEDTIPYDGIFLLDSSGLAVPAAAPLNQFSTIRKKLSLQGYGIGNSFAEAIHARTGHKILLVVNAKGGTSINVWAKDYQPKADTLNITNQPQFYSEAVRRTREAMNYGELKAILWHQGESDASPEKSAGYMKQLKQLVGDLRSDLDYVPFVAGEINSSKRDIFNPIINTLSDSIPDAYCVPATDLPMNKDNLHFSREGQIVLGHRYADIIYKVVYL